MATVSSDIAVPQVPGRSSVGCQYQLPGGAGFVICLYSVCFFWLSLFVLYLFCCVKLNLPRHNLLGFSFGLWTMPSFVDSWIRSGFETQRDVHSAASDQLQGTG